MAYVVVQRIDYPDNSFNEKVYPETEKQIKSDASYIALGLAEAHITAGDAKSFAVLGDDYVVRVGAWTITYSVREIGLIKSTYVVDPANVLNVKRTFPSEVWWRSADTAVGDVFREWQMEARKRGASPSGGDITITITIDREHEFRMRTVTVKGVLEQ